MDNRGVTPVVEKTISIGLVVLFVGGLTTTLLGGTVPDYRTGTGDEIADRVLADAADALNDAVTASNGTVRARTVTDLPGTIADDDYRIEFRGSELHLSHPNPGISASTRVALPAGIAAQNSTWRGGRFEVRLFGESGNRSIAIGST